MGHSQIVNGGQKAAALRKANGKRQRELVNREVAAYQGISVDELLRRRTREGLALLATSPRETKVPATGYVAPETERSRSARSGW